MMIMPLYNMKNLRDDMRNKGRHITASLFNYNARKYVVVYEDLDNIKKNTYFLLRITFVDLSDGRELECNGNTKGLNVQISTLKDFFFVRDGVKYVDWIGSFYETFGPCIPSAVSIEPMVEEKLAMINVLDKRDTKNNGEYCFGVKRNPKVNGVQYQRSPFNTDKTLLKRPALFEKLGEDSALSFLYTNDKDKEKTDAEILEDFALKEGFKVSQK